MNDNDPWTPETLDLPERDSAELAGLLGMTAVERKPPARLKARIFAAIRPAPLTPPSIEPTGVASRYAPYHRAFLLAAFVAAAVLLIFGGIPPRQTATLAHIRGSVLVDGSPAIAGQSVKAGQVISTADGEAVLVFDRRAAIRLLHGGEAVFRGRPAIEIELRRGGLLSAVVSGIPYSIVTEQGRVAALGTDFMVRRRPTDTFFCICHGNLKISGDFGEARAASKNHRGLVFTKSRAPYEPSDGTMEGHTQNDILSLREFLNPSSGR